MTTLLRASNEWRTRPADQRFQSLDDVLAVTKHHLEVATEAPRLPLKSLAIALSAPVADAPADAPGDAPEPVLVGPSGEAARFNAFSFRRFAREVDAPGPYLATLPAPIAVDALSYGLSKAEDKDVKLLLARNGDLRVRAITGPDYRRIWNAEVVEKAIRLTHEQPGWQPAPASFDGSRGLYASDEDVFLFLVDNDRRIFESLPGGGLSRGFFISNSEVGKASFRITSFLYQYICGNHMVWGASGVKDIRIPHIGNADTRAWREIDVELRKYAESSATDEESKVASMRRITLGGTKDEVLDRVFKLGIPKRLATTAYDTAVEHEDWYGAPTTVFGMVSGITEVARDKANADDRTEIERMAAKVAQCAF